MRTPSAVAATLTVLDRRVAEDACFGDDIGVLVGWTEVAPVGLVIQEANLAPQTIERVEAGRARKYTDFALESQRVCKCPCWADTQTALIIVILLGTR